MPQAGHAEAAAVRLEEALRTGPFHHALRAALAARRMPLQRVQHHLARRGVKLGLTSLSYWQQGARRPQRPESLRAVRLLEEILQLPPDSLIRLLAQPAPRTAPQRPPSCPYGALTGEAAAVERLLGEFGAPLDGGLHTLSHHETVRIGVHRELLARESQRIVRAHTEGVDRHLVIHQGAPGCVPERIQVRALENCRLGRVCGDGSSGVVVAELLFDVRLDPGGTHLFRYGVGDGTGGEATEYLRGFGFAGGQYALQVRFSPGVLPVRCHRFSRLTATAPPSDRGELALHARHRSVHLVEAEVTTGILGIGWEWGEG